MAISTTSHGFSVFTDPDSDLMATVIAKAMKNGAGTVSDPKSNIQLIDDQFTADEARISALESGKATKAKYTATLGTTWTGGSAPYTQVVPVSGLLATDENVTVDIDVSDTFETAESEEEEWAKIYRIDVGAGQITVYAKEQTTVSLSLKISVVR